SASCPTPRTRCGSYAGRGASQRAGCAWGPCLSTRCLLLPLRFLTRGSGSQTQLTFAQHCVHTRNFLTHRTKPTVVGELTGCHLEAQIEQLFLGLAQTILQLVVGQFAKFAGTHSHCHQKCSSRVTMRALIGS